MNLPSTNVTSLSWGLLQYRWSRLAQHHDHLANLDDKYVQRVEFATYPKARPTGMQFKPTKSRLKRNALRAANDNIKKAWDIDQRA